MKKKAAMRKKNKKAIVPIQHFSMIFNKEESNQIDKIKKRMGKK